MELTVAEARALGLWPKAKGRKKKAQLPYSYKPHDCVTLGIDLGRTSGWGILYRGGQSWPCFKLPPDIICAVSEQSNNPEDWWLAVIEAKQLARLKKVPLVVVMETWTQGSKERDQRFRAMQLLGLGEVRGEWKRLLKTAGVPKRRIMMVNAMTWRAKLFGGRMNRRRAEWKSLAKERALARFGDGLRHSFSFGDDAAEGLCLAEYGAHAGKAGQIVKQAGRRSP